MMNCGLILPFDIRDIDYGRLTFEVIESNVPELMPSKCGDAEPFKTSFSDRDAALKSHWSQGLYWNGQASEIDAGVSHASRPKAPFSSISFWDRRTNDNCVRTEPLKNMVNAFASIWSVTIAYIHSPNKSEFDLYKDNDEERIAISHGFGSKTFDILPTHYFVGLLVWKRLHRFDRRRKAVIGAGLQSRVGE